MVMMMCKSSVSLFSQIGRKPSTQDPLTGTWTCGTCQRTPATMATRMRTWSYGCAPPHCPPSASCIAASTTRTPPSARVCPRAAMRSPSLTVSKPGIVRWCRACVQTWPSGVGDHLTWVNLRSGDAGHVCSDMTFRCQWSLTVSKPGVVRWCRACVFRHDFHVSVITYCE